MDCIKKYFAASNVLQSNITYIYENTLPGSPMRKSFTRAAAHDAYQRRAQLLMASRQFLKRAEIVQQTFPGGLLSNTYTGAS